MKHTIDITRYAFAASILFLLTACGGGSSGGGGGGTSAQVFNTDNQIELSTPQLGRNSAGTLHMLAASPVLNAQGGTVTRYGTCTGNCGSAASWTFITLDAGVFDDSVKMAVEPGGRVHVVELLSTKKVVRYATCALSCTAPSSWKAVDIAMPVNFSNITLPAGRAFALSANGKPRMLLNAYAGLGPQVMLLGCDATCADGNGWSVNPLVSGKATAASMTPGDPQQAVIALEQNFAMIFTQCASQCANVGNWTQVTLGRANTTLLSLVSGANNELHLVFKSSVSVPDDQTIYAHCSGQCAQGTSWTFAEVQRGNAGRGGLDIALSDSGKIAIAQASVINDTQKLTWSHCSGACTQSASWISSQLEMGANVSDPHPAQSGVSCDSPLRFWAVGNAVQMIGTAQGGFQLSYDAASYAQCLGIQPPTSYVSGRYIRLMAQSAP